MAQDQTAPENSDNNEEVNAAESGPFTVKPEFWENLLDAMPPWIDEISAIVLLVFGIISFMALMDVSSDAKLSLAWSEALRNLFGYGSLFVSGGIFGLGVVILLPKLGIIIRLSPRRILALEIAFIAILGILHLSSGDEELRAVARAGEGGGLIGWGISYLPDYLFGSTVALMLFSAVLMFSIGLAIGIRQQHLTGWIERGRERLEAFGSKLVSASQESPLDAVMRRPQPVLTPELLELQRQSKIMRIRPELSNLPPSQRRALLATAEAEIPVEQAHEEAQEPVVHDEVHQRLERAFSHPDEEALEQRRYENSPIGELIPKKSKTMPQMVRRPDGRIKRFFNISSMKEDKKLIKRDKSLPSLDIFQDVTIVPPDEEEINHNVVLIENTLLEFDIDIDVVEVKIGPTVTQYAVQPYRDNTTDDGEITRARTRLSKIAALSNDLALSLSAKRLRLETPVPGQSYMGVEVPNKNPSTVALRSVYESRTFYDQSQKSRSPLLVPLGRNVAGEPVIVDIGGMPHLLIAGTTGSGKSVCIAAIATALILNNTPDTIRMVMLDPKMVELSRFNGLPHLLGPVETDIDRIIEILRWCTREMERRYKLLEEAATRNIDTYNTRLGQRRKSEHLPYIVIMVDEIGDLMMSRPEETEHAITRLAQMARAVGMHLIIATQRPSVDVITGLIKANFPARISFAVASGVDSRVILDSVGAETLLGQGDMLYLAQDAAGPRRLQGCYVSDNEVRAVVDHWKNWHQKRVDTGKAPSRMTAPWERGLTRREFLAETDPMLEEAIELVVEEQEASASQIQRKLGLGYPRAARIIDLLEELGVIGEQVAGGRTRKVLIEKGKDPFKEILDRRTKEKQQQEG